MIFINPPINSPTLSADKLYNLVPGISIDDCKSKEMLL